MNAPAACCAASTDQGHLANKRTTEAAHAIANFRTGLIDASTAIAAIRRDILTLPLIGSDEVLVGRASGIYWLYAFTSQHTLARFVTARGEDNRTWPFASVRGARLLDDTLRQLPAPCGVAVDVAGPSPMLLPPVAGIVPDDLAIDVHPRRDIAGIDLPPPPVRGG